MAKKLGALLKITNGSVVFLGLHEEVDYSEKLKFSDDEDEHAPSDRNKMWYEFLLYWSLLVFLFCFAFVFHLRVSVFTANF